MYLSSNAIKDLRIALSKSYGEGFQLGLSDDEVNKIGLLLLIALAESLKLEIINPELIIKAL
ncbi:MAG: hypothetical protein PHF79_01145 [Candidatus Pacebacteria bacterium]|nr:hypothetical protein [Candidatus Paceibacterota bacterium]